MVAGPLVASSWVPSIYGSSGSIGVQIDVLAQITRLTVLGELLCQLLKIISC
jgi:hypothetical protein